jgi:integrase
MATEYTTITAILYKSKTLANGEHPIMLRVSKNRKRTYSSLQISCRPDLWDDAKNLPKKKHPHKDHIEAIISKSITAHKDKLMEMKHDGKDFTPDVLIAEATKKTKRTTLFSFFEEKIQSLKDRKQIGNSKVYQDTLNQVKKFTNSKDITFSQVDFGFLLKLETYFKAKGISDNALSVRFRTIRAIFNAAIAENYIKKDNYPFTKFKIAERYSTKTRKRAITKEDIKNIEKVNFEKGSTVYEAQQYFLFIYYAQGINFMDISHLKWSNLIDGRIFYTRAKTGGEMNIKLPAPALSIIENFKNTETVAMDDYIFPVLSKDFHKTPMQQHNRIRKVMSRLNKDLKEVAEKAEVKAHLTTYVARHTFATVLKRSGVSTAIISQSMGHQTEAITQTYLNSFENNIIDEAMENLL